MQKPRMFHNTNMMYHTNVGILQFRQTRALWTIPEKTSFSGITSHTACQTILSDRIASNRESLRITSPVNQGAQLCQTGPEMHYLHPKKNAILGLVKIKLSSVRLTL
jgi:hypothetical protein